MYDHNLWAVCQQRTLVPPLNSDANAAPVSVQALLVQCHYSAVTDVGLNRLETTGSRVLDIIFHT